MSGNHVPTENNNKEVKLATTTTTDVKVFEVRTNSNEIITIKKEPHDFVEYAAVDSLRNTSQDYTETQKTIASSSETKVQHQREQENLIVSYEVENWNLSEVSKADARRGKISGNSRENKKISIIDDDDETDEDLTDTEEEFEEDDIDISDLEEVDEEKEENASRELSNSPDRELTPSTQDHLSPEPEDEEDEICTTTDFNGMKIESTM